MAFPTIPTVAAGRVLTLNQLNTTATRTFPALSGLTKNSGDLLIAIIVAYQAGGTNAAFSGWSDGFTEFHDTNTATTLAMGAAYKWSTGSETAAITVTQAATIAGDASMILLSIPGVHATIPPEAGSRASGTAAAADPAAFNPAGWDVEDTLWISVVGSGMTSGTGAWTATGTAGPTNFSDWVDTNAADTSTIGDCEAAVSFRQLAAASEDVGTAGVDLSNARNGAFVIAVPPAPSFTGTAAVTLADFTPTATGVVITSVHTETFNKADGDLGPDFAPYDEIGVSAVQGAIVTNRVRFTAPGQTGNVTDWWLPTLPFAATNDIQASIEIPTIDIGTGAGYAIGGGVVVRAAEVAGPWLRGYYAEFTRNDALGDLIWLALIRLNADGTGTLLTQDIRTVASTGFPVTVTLTVVGDSVQARAEHSGSSATFFCKATDTTWTAGTAAISGRVDNGATTEGFSEIDNFVVRLIGHVGTVTQTLGDFTSTATGQLGYSGTSAQTLADFAATATGQLGSTGTSAQTLDDFTSTASGMVEAGASFSGTAAVTLGDFTSTASGTHVPPEVTGTSAQTLADFTSTASGTVVGPGVSGTAAVTLDDFTSTASGTVVNNFTGTVAVVLDDFISTTTGIAFGPPITGTVDVVLDAFVMEAKIHQRKTPGKMPRRFYRMARPY